MKGEMTMKAKKSAKDIAFDKERAEYRKHIRAVEHVAEDKQKQIIVLEDKVEHLEEQLREKEDWIQRLLEYTDMTKEEIRDQVKNEKSKKEFVQKINCLFGIPGGYFR